MAKGAKRRGRKEWRPTRKERTQAKQLVAAGLRLTEVARVLGVSVPTLRKHCADELAKGLSEANGAVAQSLFRQATAKRKPNVIAGIFWLKSRAGWVEEEKRLRLEQSVGKKANAAANAATVAETSKFRPSAPPRLATVNGAPVDPPATEDQT